MLDSTTWEEAAAHLRIADKQRRRWLKGFAQTGFMYTRHPVRTSREMGLKKWFFYNLLMLGTPFTLLLNPFFWAATVIYFATRATVIVELFPLPLYYLGLTLMVAGNLALFYQLIAACMKREGYGSMKYMVLAPVWWVFTTWSAYAMLLELIVRPHHWHKTVHGHDLAKEEAEIALTY
jgi:cellulose synthase/poly-beta-1,6-N-acetylglucosamine synthase-like glycosyltransferase